MRPVLRALSGIRPGATYLVHERVTLGRAAIADVQLVDESVSRFHALIERQPDGHFTIADLDSKSGMRVDGKRVRRAVLEAGAVVEICGFRLRYELDDGDAPVVAVPKVNGFVTVRQTRREVPQMTDDDDQDDRAQAAPAQAARSVDRGPRRASEVPTQPEMHVVPSETVVAPPNDAQWLVVLREVVEYRGLVDVGARDSTRARLLATKFANVEHGAANYTRRAGRRLPCRTSVMLGVRRGPEVVTSVAEMIDCGAEGAKLRSVEPLPVGTVCWLLVATGDGERSGIAFSARVVWTHAETGDTGVAFIGRPIFGPDVLPPMRR